MFKTILIIAAIVLVGIAIYYGRFLFTKRVVREELPSEMIASQIIKQGEFKDIDFIHRGSGQAKLLEDNNGHKLIRLENFQTTDGPDLYVYLSRNSVPTTKLESLGDFISLGRLKGNFGDQNYEITQNIEGYNTVVIWCRQFSALFTFAVLN